MRQPSSIEPFTPSPTVTLHPALQAALDNLDVQIEEELTRYRRQRRYPTAVTRKKPFIPQPTDGSAIGILKNSIQLPTPRSSIYDQLPQQSPSQPQRTTEPAAAYPKIAPVAPSPAATVISPSPAPAASVSFAASVPGEPGRIESYAQQHDLSAYAPNAVLQNLIHQSDAETSIPEDYLASSEELLRSIAEEDPELRADREPNSLLDTLLTPLGMGSMLLLLLSSTTLGYMIMNPSSLGWQPPNQSGSPASKDLPTANSGSAHTPSPDLASEEFPDLNLDTLSTLPKQATPINPASGAKSAKAAKPGDISSQTATKPNAASTAPVASSASTPGVALPAPAPQPSLSTVYVPANPPVVSAPKPAIQPPAPAPVPEISPEPISSTPPSVAPDLKTPDTPAVATAPLNESNLSESNGSFNPPRYYVVTEYSGDTSLQQARDAVPDAYVRNLPSEGAKVQLGAFSDQAKAQELQQQLQDQGIQAEVYQP